MASRRPTDDEVHAFEREFATELPRSWITLLRDYPPDFDEDEHGRLVRSLDEARDATEELRSRASETHGLGESGSIEPGCVGLGSVDGDGYFFRPGEGDRVFVLDHEAGTIDEEAPDLASYVRGIRVLRHFILFCSKILEGPGTMPPALLDRGLHPYVRTAEREMVIFDRFDEYEEQIALDDRGAPTNGPAVEARITESIVRVLPRTEPVSRIYRTRVDGEEWVIDLEENILAVGTTRRLGVRRGEGGTRTLSELPLFHPYASTTDDPWPYPREFTLLEESEGVLSVRFGSDTLRLERLR
ncbi:MAG: SMI1/KNR4 family protein [Planctomycetes bacterium]|nr:SMI1/KNR4 family protein [Planctomycetota bacterium]